MMEREPELGDEVVTGEALATGDLVYFDGPTNGKTVIRQLLTWQVKSSKRKIYRVEPGATPESARFRLVTGGADD